MSTEGMSPVLVDQYGGLCTLIDRSDLPVGLSPDCQNVEFFPGGVRSRNGLVTYGTNANNIQGLMTFVDTSDVRHCLTLAGGSIQDHRLTTFNNIPFGDTGYNADALTACTAIRGTALFGNAYVGLSAAYDPSILTLTPQRPTPLPFALQFDGTRFLALSQEAPSACFTVTNTGGGSIGMSAGRHDFVVVYETSTGYVTAPSGPVGDTFTAGDYAALAAIPVGPGFINKRIIFATPAGSTSFFTLERFVLNDNTTTTLAVDFTDSELLAGTSLEDFVDKVPISGAVGVEKYGSRMVYWGRRGGMSPFFDASATTQAPVLVGLSQLAFDGKDGALPAEWTAVTTGGTVGTASGLILQGYTITGDGATAKPGSLSQVALNYAYSGVRYVWPNRRYGVRVYAKTSVIAGTITVRVSATAVASSGTTVASVAFDGTIGTGTFRWFDGGASATGAAAGQYVNITIETTGTPANGTTAVIGAIEFYEASDATWGSLLGVSPPDDPETLNAATGFVSVAPNDGQVITDVFAMRGNLYVAKSDSLYVVTDNGGDPSEWSVDLVSSTVGCVSMHGVAVGDGWALITARSGYYYFTGGVPEKISQEIQPTWNNVNWLAGALVWNVVDTFAKRAYVSVPLETHTAVETIYVMDFVEGFGDPIAGGGSGRKWTTWALAAPAGAMVDSAYKGRQEFTVGIAKRLGRDGGAQGSDFLDTAIVAYYETAPIGTELGRSLFDRLVMRIRGAGDLSTQSRTPGGTLTTLPVKALALAPDDDVEIKMHANQTQVGFRIGTSLIYKFWNLRRLGVFLKPSAFSYLRKT